MSREDIRHSTNLLRIYSFQLVASAGGSRAVHLLLTAAADTEACSCFYSAQMVVVVPDTDEKMPVEVAHQSEESPSLDSEV